MSVTFDTCDEQSNKKSHEDASEEPDIEKLVLTLPDLVKDCYSESIDVQENAIMSINLIIYTKDTQDTGKSFLYESGVVPRLVHFLGVDLVNTGAQYQALFAIRELCMYISQ